MFVLRSTHKAALAAHERERQHWQRLERDLIDRVMYLCDRPWGLPEREPVETGLRQERYYLDGANEVTE